MLSLTVPLVRFLSSFSLIAVVAAVSGCHSAPESQSLSVQENVDDSARKLEEASVELQDTVVPLRQILDGRSTDVRKSFGTFSSGVDSVEDVQGDLRSLAATRREESAQFRARAEEKLAEIHDEGIREDSRERTRDIVQRLEDLGRDHDEMLADLDRVTLGLNDVRKALSIDMSAAGVDSIRSPANKIAGSIDDLRENLLELAAKHRRIAAGLSSTEQR